MKLSYAFKRGQKGGQRGRSWFMEPFAFTADQRCSAHSRVSRHDWSLRWRNDDLSFRVCWGER